MLPLAWFGDGVANADDLLLGALTVVIAVVSIWVVWKRNWILDRLSSSSAAE